MAPKQNIEILKTPKLITTKSGSTGWLVGIVDGVEWVAYERADVRGMKQVLKKRLTK